MSEKDLQEQIRQANRFIETGIDSYVFISNQFASQDEGDDVAKKRIETLLSNIDGNSFGVYECPYPYKRLLTPEPAFMVCKDREVWVSQGYLLQPV